MLFRLLPFFERGVGVGVGVGCVCVYFRVIDGDVVLKRIAGCASGLCIIPASTEPLFQVPVR
jgi:hypothetical protein